LSSTSESALLKMCDLQVLKSRNVCTWIRTELTFFLVSYLFVICLMTLVVPQTTHCDVIGLLMNMDWKSRVLYRGLLGLHFVICLDGQRKNMKDFGENTWLISQNVKWETPIYKAVQIFWIH
jgi:hypothetical protein